MTIIQNITQEELDSIRLFAMTGNQSNFNAEAIAKFQSISSALTKRLLESNTKLIKEKTVMECRLSKYRKKESEAIRQNLFTDTQLDSADIANVLLYCLQERNPYRLSKSKVILILYEMYASWLESKKERLFVEHPCASEWGPQFWRAYKKLDITQKVPYKRFEALAQQNSAIAKFCKNAAEKYYDYKESDLRTMFINSEPYRNAMPNNNNGKWGKDIADSEIYAWRSARK